MSVKFLGADNGLIDMNVSPSDCPKIRTAPADGYIPDYLCWDGFSKRLQVETNYDHNRCFCFRIRTKRDKQGNIVEAHYGKIYHDIKYEYKNDPFVPVASVRFLYYLNPKSLDRNLEWDRTTNLCPTAGKHESGQP